MAAFSQQQLGMPQIPGTANNMRLDTQTPTRRMPAGWTPGMPMPGQPATPAPAAGAPPAQQAKPLTPPASRQATAYTAPPSVVSPTAGNRFIDQRAQQYAQSVSGQPPLQEPAPEQNFDQGMFRRVVGADGTQAGGGAPPNQTFDLSSIMAGLGTNAVQAGGGAPPNQTFDLNSIMAGLGTNTVQAGGGAPAPAANQVQNQASATSAPAALSPQIQQLLSGIPLPGFKSADLGAMGAQAEARSAQTEARMNRNTRNSFANSGVQARGPAMAGEMNLNAARARGGLEDTLANLGIEQANQYNTNAPRFGSLMVDLLNSGNAREGQSLSFLSSLLSGLGSFV